MGVSRYIMWKLGQQIWKLNFASKNCVSGNLMGKNCIKWKLLVKWNNRVKCVDNTNVVGV